MSTKKRIDISDLCLLCDTFGLRCRNLSAVTQHWTGLPTWPMAGRHLRARQALRSPRRYQSSPTKWSGRNLALHRHRRPERLPALHATPSHHLRLARRRASLATPSHHLRLARRRASLATPSHHRPRPTHSRPQQPMSISMSRRRCRRCQFQVRPLQAIAAARKRRVCRRPSQRAPKVRRRHRRCP
jgi:hypothetical protein